MSWIFSDPLSYKVERAQQQSLHMEGGLDPHMPTTAVASNISCSLYLWPLQLNGEKNTQAWFIKRSACYLALGIKGTVAIKYHPRPGTVLKDSGEWKSLQWAEFRAVNLCMESEAA